MTDPNRHESEKRSEPDQVERLRSRMEELTAPPHIPARCLALVGSERGREAYLSVGGQPRVVPVDECVALDAIGPGTEVLLSHTLNRVVGVLPAALPLHGDTAVLERVIADGGFLVSIRGESRTVVPMNHLRGQSQPGDLLQLDASGVFALQVVSGSAADEYAIRNCNDLPSFDEIGGLEKEIQRIRDLVLLQSQHSGVRQRYGIPRTNSILFAGRTGCGKTLLARATCRFIGELAGSGQSRFAYVSPSDLQDMWYGGTQKRISRLFASARSAAERDPLTPFVIYIDEIDAYLSRRQSSYMHRASSETTASLLAEMDGFRGANFWLMGATNRMQDLDPAALRAGRFENIITFGALSRPAAREIFRKHLPATLPYAGGGRDGIIDSIVAVLYAPNGDNAVATLQLKDGTRREVRACDMLSGAEIALIARFAKERAGLREINLGEASGICLNDLAAGAEQFLEKSGKKLRPHNCRDYLEELPDDLEVTKVEPARRWGTTQLQRAEEAV